MAVADVGHLPLGPLEPFVKETSNQDGRWNAVQN